MDELMNLNAQYLTTYPDSESPLSYFAVFGEVKLIEILKEAAGRKIIFIINELADDDVTYQFVNP